MAVPTQSTENLKQRTSSAVDLGAWGAFPPGCIRIRIASELVAVGHMYPDLFLPSQHLEVNNDAFEE